MGARSLAILLGAVVAASFGTASARATSIDLASGPATLQAIYDAGGIATYGDLTFNFGVDSSFSSTVIGTGNAPDAAAITVSALSSVPGEPGLLFQGNWFSSGGTSADTHFTFTVSTSDGALIEDDYLHTTGSISGTANWIVNETVTNNAGATLANFYVNNLTLQNTVTATFPPQSSLIISKDIQLGSGTDGLSSISDVSQGFSTIAVPVPAAALTGFSTLLGIAGLALLRRRRLA